MAEAVRLGLVIGQLVQGGAERQLLTLLEGIRRERFQPTVFCLSDLVEPMGPLVRATGTEVVVVPRRGHFDVSRVFRLARELRERRIQLLHAYLLEANIYAGLARLRTGRIPLITSNRNAAPSRNLVRHVFDRWGLARGARILVNSEDLLRFTRSEYGLPPERFELVYNGLDLARFDAAGRDEKLREELGAGSGELLVGTLGRVVPQKNPELFLEVAKRVAARRPEARFVWVGTGEMEGWMAAELRRRGLGPVVRLAGARADVPRVLKALDLVLQTSRAEGLPNVVLEAMAAGRPVVATDVGGTRELLDDLGRLCPAGAVEPLADAVLEMLGDPEGRRLAGQAGRRRAEERFSAAAMVRKMERLYETVLSEP